MTLNITRKQLLNSLRGSIVVLPDVQSVLRHWPQNVNPHLSRLRDDVEKYLEK